MSNAEFNKALELLGDHVNDNVKVITPKDLKVPFLFRVDAKLPKVFIPSMPRSAAGSENSTVARVVTAPTLFGCMSGHSHMVWLLLDRDIGEGGLNHYRISAFDFEKALLPNKKLVYDAEDTEEAWLIAYNKETTEYKYKYYGEMFFHKVSVHIKGNAKVNTHIVDFCIHVAGDQGMPFTNGIFLEKGYYYVKGDFSRYALPGGKGVPKRLSVSGKDDDLFEFTKISDKVYKSFKDISVTK